MPANGEKKCRLFETAVRPLRVVLSQADTESYGVLYDKPVVRGAVVAEPLFWTSLACDRSKPASKHKGVM